MDRAKWLAELADVLDQAQKLVWSLAMIEARGSETLDLYARLEAARAEVQALRLSRKTGGSANLDPNWGELLPWAKGPREPRT